ncbi:MAG: hypothetical protein RIQ89_1033 [Bacteroidota bacterium]|jgi:hypothetical protein
MTIASQNTLGCYQKKATFVAKPFQHFKIDKE